MIFLTGEQFKFHVKLCLYTRFYSNLNGIFNIIKCCIMGLSTLKSHNGANINKGLWKDVLTTFIHYNTHTHAHTHTHTHVIYIYIYIYIYIHIYDNHICVAE